MSVTVRFTAPFHLSKDGLTITRYQTGQIDALSLRQAEIVINERVAEILQDKIDVKAEPELENKAEPALKNKGRKK